MITQTELEELIREHGLAPYVYIKSEKEQFKINLMSHANYIKWRENPHQTALLTIAKDTNGKNIIKTIENFDNINDFAWVDFQEELIQNVTILLNQERLDDLKLFLRLGLKWFKYSPIDMYYHYHNNKPQAYWRKWLIERTYMDDDEALWSTWSQVQRMFWW